MAESEKITINMNVVDLGKIDLLVDKGFYSNRTDFIKAAIRDLLDEHDDDLERGFDRNTWVLGATDISRKALENAHSAGEKISVFVIGLLVVRNDVTPELIRAAVKSCHVYGVIRASDAVKQALADLKED